MLFLDTTVLVGAADERDACHDDGKRILLAVATGRHGAALTSTFVLDEVITILSGPRRVGAAKAAAFVAKVMASPRVKVLPVGTDDFLDALAEHPRLGGLDLSFTDTTSVVLMRSRGCTVICSHDTGFDKVKGIRRAQSLDSP